MKTRTQIQIKGIVQGVGFRPFVFALAEKNALKGRVLNNAVGVLVDVEGENEKIAEFIDALQTNPPPLSVIESIELNNPQDPTDFKDFRIVESNANGARFTPISADIATCADCLGEMFDSQNRRFRYPFINCTNCGPRFTIIENVPYDRSETTMREFEMCIDCRAEYENPANRRFHAEPTCCPKCGPQVFLSVPSALADVFRRTIDPPAHAGGTDIVKAKQLLESGKILAVKGLGGFHLVCDALNADAVETLRSRKHREDKPFALMANSVEVIERYCFVSERERELLLSKERPIVLLERKQGAEIPEAVAPKINSLGFMLPYTPLHFLLLEMSEKPLVMTSGNISDEPICYQDSEAEERLKNIADHYLLHNRRIHIRTDDSVVRVRTVCVSGRGFDKAHSIKSSNSYPPAHADGSDKTIVLRRSRGYAPAPVKTSFKFKKQILACGAELKNTFCLTRDNYAFLSHHIGDLENLETFRSFTEGIAHYKKLFNLAPEIVAYDLHPEYLSTKFALETDAEKIGVQHHHAHIASCLADNRAEGEVIGVAMDGSGFGIDGKIWGGEFFVADFRAAERIAHLDYIPLVGGAKAIREPWRIAAVYLQKTFGHEFLDLDLPFVQSLNLREWKTLQSMIQSDTNSPETSSMGRLFDAVSSLLGLRNSVNYEGQAAIELEMIADQAAAKSYEFEIEESRIIKSEKVVREAVEDLLNGVSVSAVSARFHLAVARLIAKIARQTRDERNLTRVALSGGVFQNMFLLERVCRLLESDGFEVLTHSRVPCNDGGISLGQAAVANARILSGEI
ncbi:MAG TPA: carbamoyltransferase HypF [Pyrinomonadaceae bacterium]|nr:carbamoyltransferase HypF [Pyrinomonadaceae bacterium]